MPETKLAIGLRVYEKTREALALKMRFLENIPWSVVSKVFVAVNVEKDKSGALEYFNVVLADSRIEAFPVQPWGQNVPALNAIVLKAAKESFTHLCFISTKVVINESLLLAMLNLFDSETLVVGAVVEGHDFQGREDGLPVWAMGTGRTVPYNTCIVWDVRGLSRTLFHWASEMPYDEELAGLEEFATIIEQQQRFSGGTKAKLVNLGPIETQTEHWDEDRAARHQKIILEKEKKAEAQIKLLECRDWRPSIWHFNQVRQ